MRLTKNEYLLLKNVAQLGWQNMSRLNDHDIGRAVILQRAGMVQIKDETIIGISPEGRHAMEEYREYVVEQRWTRGMAFAAIIISVLSLIATSEWLREQAAQWLARFLR